jgi:hypothetical protein
VVIDHHGTKGCAVAAKPYPCGLWDNKGEHMLYIKVVKNGILQEHIQLSNKLTPSDTNTLVNMLHQQHLSSAPTAKVEVWFGRDGEYAIKVKG